MKRVAVAQLAAVSARQVPRVGCALVAVLANHIWEAATLAAAAVTVAVVR